MMKKIKVNSDACIGCGACVAIDSEHFAFNDEGLSKAINQDNLESEDLKNAIDTCPTSAISILESDEEESNLEENTCECEACDCKHDKKCECNHEEE